MPQASTDQLKEYAPLVGRKESQRWVASTSYDGDGWGDEYDDLETVQEEPSPQTSPNASPKPASHTLHDHPRAPAVTNPGPTPVPAAAAATPPTGPASSAADADVGSHSSDSGLRGAQLVPSASATAHNDHHAHTGHELTGEPEVYPAAADTGDAGSILSTDLSVENGNEDDDDYRDIYGYYEERSSHPYSQFARDSAHYTDSSTASLSTGHRSVANSGDLDSSQTVNAPSTMHANQESAEKPDAFHVSQLSNDMGAAKITELPPTSATPTPGGSSSLPAASDEPRSTNPGTNRRQRPSYDEQQDIIAKQILGSLNSPSHSRDTSIADQPDPEVAALYQGTSEFLARPLSVYENDTQPLSLPRDDSIARILVPASSQASTPKASDVAQFPDSNAVGQDENISERPRWEPVRSRQHSDAPAPEIAAAVASGRDTTPVEEVTPAVTKLTEPDTQATGRDLHINGKRLSTDSHEARESVDTHERGASQDSRTSSAGTPDSTTVPAVRNLSATSANTQMTTISDNPLYADMSFGAHPQAGVDPVDRERSLSLSQQAQILAKVKRPPVVDFGALLKNGSSEARLSQLTGLRSREADYITGLESWLASVYGTTDPKQVYTTGLPPTKETRSFSTGRQVSSAMSSAMSSSTKTKEAMAQLGEKSTAKARSLLAKGRRLVRSGDS